jgi:hypothetical protein
VRATCPWTYRRSNHRVQRPLDGSRRRPSEYRSYLLVLLLDGKPVLGIARSGSAVCGASASPRQRPHALVPCPQARPARRGPATLLQSHACGAHDIMADDGGVYVLCSGGVYATAPRPGSPRRWLSHSPVDVRPRSVGAIRTYFSEGSGISSTLQRIVPTFTGDFADRLEGIGAAPPLHWIGRQ